MFKLPNKDFRANYYVMLQPVKSNTFGINGKKLETKIIKAVTFSIAPKIFKGKKEKRI